MRVKPTVYVLDLIPLYQDEDRQSESVEFNLIRESLVSLGFNTQPMTFSEYQTEFIKLQQQIDINLTSLLIGLPTDKFTVFIKKITDHKWSLILN